MVVANQADTGLFLRDVSLDRIKAVCAWSLLLVMDTG